MSNKEQDLTDISIEDIFPSNKSFMKVVYPNRNLFGLWKADIKTYGGLLLVKGVSGGVEGWELLAPRIQDFMGSIRIRPLFRIFLLENNSADEDEVTCVCLGQPYENGEPHKAEVQMKETDTFEFRCSLAETHLKESRKSSYLRAWLDEERGKLNGDQQNGNKSYHSDHLLQKRFLGVRKCRFQYAFQRLDVTIWDREFGFGHKPIPAGLFKGTYDCHGVEIVQLTYEINDKGEPQVKAQKITGDPQIPAKKMAFKANLNLSIIFSSKIEQSTIKRLEELQITKVPYRGHSGRRSCNPQPFVLPANCTVDYGLKPPKACRHRFIGWAQYAEEGFVNPALSKGHWIVFNEDLFGFLHFEPSTFSLFHRITNFDPDPPSPNLY